MEQRGCVPFVGVGRVHNEGRQLWGCATLCLGNFLQRSQHA